MIFSQAPAGLGIDFGGVIIGAVGGDSDHAVAWAFSGLPPLPGAFATIKEMNVRLDGRVWIVSKAGPETQRMTREWLCSHHFCEETGIPLHHVHFVQDRTGKLEKCRELGITHFVDDRRENLEVLKRETPHLFLFGETSADAPIVAARGWPELCDLLRVSVDLYERGKRAG